ncbi:radical SAM enzyme [Conidiobolus coronatus NRRL 28638]|uniref:Radical S-adenosyl methionine domain-containing protein 1, mitochondrial n=1 Tax=Conidiobolus coronatus (strain ATCC 28846 / CBS 209.66 / NRRL 28638) TaxID=796925 RepID=A0A137PFI3_CONC2|nr:radical SAM enzyme [Conidiobolus coronatus NRRL 28638]|eukprot:KXN73766.1 radical SAM enzyme [Conidiobolus coronatus NRRL 28638]
MSFKFKNGLLFNRLLSKEINKKINYLPNNIKFYSTIKPEISSDSFSIYIHWPYCERKCYYCSFNKYVQPNPDIKRLVASYKKEIEYYLKRTNKVDLKSIYFGGGTPSLAPIEAIDSILREINSNFSIPKNCEITLEANPNKLETEKLKEFRSIGINRVSIGIQSFNDDRLRQMGRDHTSEEAKNCLNIANKLFPKFNFDMIFAHPNQSLNEWKKDLDTALSFNPTHMSIYQLMIEAGTPYHKSVSKGNLELPTDEIMEDMYWHNIEKLKSIGIQQYEASNFSKPGHESTHNFGYWKGIEYIGIGPGAHGRVSFNNTSTNFKEQLCRTYNIMSPNSWMDQCELTGNGF